MAESILSESVDSLSEPRSSAAVRSILYGGLTVGVLDGTAACVGAGLRSGATPDMVFHYIASALLGREASYNGGVQTVALGVLIHFCVALGAATGFYFVSRLVPAALRQPLVSGPLWGIVVYFAMGYLIVPLTAAPKLQSTGSGMIIGICIHIICVGFPIALWARAMQTK